MLCNDILTVKNMLTLNVRDKLEDEDVSYVLRRFSSLSQTNSFKTLLG